MTKEEAIELIKQLKLEVAGRRLCLCDGRKTGHRNIFASHPLATPARPTGGQVMTKKKSISKHRHIDNGGPSFVIKYPDIATENYFFSLSISASYLGYPNIISTFHELNVEDLKNLRDLLNEAIVDNEKVLSEIE